MTEYEEFLAQFLTSKESPNLIQRSMLEGILEASKEMLSEDLALEPSLVLIYFAKEDESFSFPPIKTAEERDQYLEVIPLDTSRMKTFDDRTAYFFELGQMRASRCPIVTCLVTECWVRETTPEQLKTLAAGRSLNLGGDPESKEFISASAMDIFTHQTALSCEFERREASGELSKRGELGSTIVFKETIEASETQNQLLKAFFKGVGTSFLQRAMGSVTRTVQ